MKSLPRIWLDSRLFCRYHGQGGTREVVRRGKKGRGNGERQLGGKVEYATLRHFPCLIICIIAAFQLLDGTLEQKDISARLTFKKYPNFYREIVPKERRSRHFTKVRETKESTRAIHKYGNEGNKWKYFITKNITWS